jgi:photosystem II stability/assembly factor-like uncharacterized protein
MEKLTFRSTSLPNYIRKITCRFLACLLVLIPTTLRPQVNFWQPTSGPPAVYVNSLVTSAGGRIFAGTSGASAESSGVFRSTNDGASWQQVGLGNMLVNAIAAYGNSSLYAGTASGVFFSTDTGLTWTSADSGLTNSYVWSLAFNTATSPGCVFAGTLGNRIFRASAVGAGWRQVYSGTGNNGVYSLMFNASGHLFAGIQYGGVIHSLDNGETWTPTALSGANIYTIAINNSTGMIFAGTNGGGVYRSADSGATWVPVNISLTNADVLSLAVNSTSGLVFAATVGGGAFRSADNGDHWSPVNSGLTTLQVWSLAINTGGYLLAGTKRGGVFRSVQTTSSAKGSDDKMPTLFSLKQNYPNPFNPSTVIEFALPQQSQVNLTIYNVLGEPVATLVDEVRPAGTYSSRFDATRLATGIYFYRLKAGEFQQTRKLVLLK